MNAETALDGKAREVDEKVGLRTRQRQARDAAILSAAFDLIAERGYDALTMESLADWVGITRQTLYHHFSNKDEIVLRAILTLVNDGIKLIEETDREYPPLERLSRIMRLLLELRFTPKRSQFSKAKLSLLPFKARPEYRAAFDRRAYALDQIVVQAQCAGQLRVDLPSAVVVQMFLSLVTEANYEELVAKGVASPTEIVESIVGTFFLGLRPTTGSS